MKGMGKGTRKDLSPGKAGGKVKGGTGVAHTKGSGGGFGIAGPMKGSKGSKGK